MSGGGSRDRGKAVLASSVPVSPARATETLPERYVGWF